LSAQLIFISSWLVHIFLSMGPKFLSILASILSWLWSILAWSTLFQSTILLDRLSFQLACVPLFALHPHGVAIQLSAAVSNRISPSAQFHF
jgi:hypothetical protein